MGKERRYSLILLVVSIAVLAAGTLVRRLFTPPEPPLTPPPDMERLQRLTSERRLRDQSEYLAEKAAAFGRRLVSPAGLAWDVGVVIAPPAPPGRNATTVVAGDRRPIELIRTPSSPQAPFSVWSAAGAPLPAAAPVRPSPGDWVLAVARNEAREIVFAPGIYQGTVKARCGGFEYHAAESGAPLSPALVGGGLFTLDGGLAGYIAECGGHPIAISASTVAQTIGRPPSPEEILEQQYGFRYALDTAGLIASVWADSPAAAAGLHPGDVVAEDERSGRPATVTRGRRTVQLHWPEAAAKPEPVRGIVFDGATIRSVAPDSPAAVSGLLAGDVVARVAGVAVESAAAAIEGARGPVVLTVERGGRRLEALLR